MSDTVAAPIFMATTADGRKNYGLFGLLAAAARGEVIDLPQRARTAVEATSIPPS